jgi:hypothetical protein
VRVEQVDGGTDERRRADAFEGLVDALLKNLTDR